MSNQQVGLTRRMQLVVLATAAFLAFGIASGFAATGSASVSGTVGDNTIDGDALSAAFHLRYVGNPAPAGYSHSYQWAEPAIVSVSPESEPVVISGSINLENLVIDAGAGTTVMIGLADIDSLAAGDNGYQRGAYIYLSANRLTGDLRVGVTDGNSGGEIVQSFYTILAADIPGELLVTLTIDGTVDPAGCLNVAGDLATADGCLTLEVDGFPTVQDSYGSINGVNGNAVEFANGGVFGWEAFPGANTGIQYDLTVSPVQVFEPESKDDCKSGGWADYGFKNQGQCIRFVNTGQDSR